MKGAFMNHDDLIFLVLALVIIFLMITGRDILDSRSSLRRALTESGRTLARTVASLLIIR
jgi:hypothetical protein